MNRSATFPLARLWLGLLSLERTFRRIGDFLTLANLFKLGTTMRDAACNGIVDAIDGGTPPGRLEHRTGAQEANVSDVSTGTLLGTNLFSNPAFGASSTGVAQASTITSDTNADASGTAGHFRIYTGAGADTAALCQGNSGTAGTDLVFDNATIVAGGTIAISSGASFTVTVPIS